MITQFGYLSSKVNRDAGNFTNKIGRFSATNFTNWHELNSGIRGKRRSC